MMNIDSTFLLLSSTETTHLLDKEPSEPFTSELKIIRIVEHPGYMETLDVVFDIEPGRYKFEVYNKTNKNSGFVVSEEGGRPYVLSINAGDTGILEITLNSGYYIYFCPLIPTPTYPIQVK
jgi:hypothetical protein